MSHREGSVMLTAYYLVLPMCLHSHSVCNCLGLYLCPSVDKNSLRKKSILFTTEFPAPSKVSGIDQSLIMRLSK